MTTNSVNENTSIKSKTFHASIVKEQNDLIRDKKLNFIILAKNNYMKRIKLVALGTFLFLSTMIIAQKDNHSKFAIKFSPTQLVTGELHFAYEQRVMKQGSIELGIGPTVSEIGINSFFFENNLGYGGVLAESSLGFFTSLQFRYYPIEGLATAPRGLYIAPELKFRQYNTIYRDEITNLGERKGAINQISFKFFTGYQFWIGGRFAIDLFT